MDDRDLARINAVGRAVLGAGLLLAPKLAARGWIGDDAALPGTQVVTRALGIRDVALGAGLLWALQNDEPVRAWITGAAAADAIDPPRRSPAATICRRSDGSAYSRSPAGSAIQMAVLARRTAVRRAPGLHASARVKESLSGFPFAEKDLMPTFIMLTRLTPEGVQTVKNNPSRIQEVNREIEAVGASVKAQWARSASTTSSTWSKRPTRRRWLACRSSSDRAERPATSRSRRSRSTSSSRRSSSSCHASW